MALSESISKQEKVFIFVIIALAVFGYFYNLGISPFLLEEPRRGLIAFEMILNDNYWVPTVMGDYYYKKPPVFNWLIVLSYKVFGYHEIAQRVVSILSHFGLSIIIYLFVKNRGGIRIAIFSALGYALGVEFLFYYSLLGEIDLFYAFVTSSSIFAIIHFGDKKQYWSLFIIVYCLTAMGFLTKGITSLPYTAISLLVYFIHKKEFKVLLGIKHVTGIILLFFLLGGFFWKYSQYAPVEEWANTLFSESADKATDGGLIEFIKHFLSFPFVALAIVFPATVFLIPWIKGKRYRKFKESPLAYLCLLIFAFNFLIYWVSIGAQTRYIYPLLPFLIIFLTAAPGESSEREGSIRVVTQSVYGITLIALIGVFFVPNLDSVKNLNASIAVLMLATLSLGFLYKRLKLNNYLVILMCLVILKIGFSSIMPVVRAYDSGSAADKRRALKMAELTKGESIYRYNGIIIDLKSSFYIERDKQELLLSDNSFEKEYYLIRESDLPSNFAYESLMEWDHHGEQFFLIRML